MVKLKIYGLFIKRLFVTLLFAAAVFSPSPSRALSCAMPDLERQLESSKAIFIGRIVKIEKMALADRNMNQLLAVVEEPIIGVSEGQNLIIYQEHWLKTVDSWMESKEETKRGLFALDTANASDVGLLLKPEQEVYFVGMCDQPYLEITDDVRKVIDTLYGNQKDTDGK